MKSTCIIISLMIHLSCYSQPTSQNHIIDSLQSALVTVKKSGDKSSEISIMYQIFLANLNQVDYNQAYINSIVLEEQLLANKTNDSAIKIAPHFYKRMGWLFSALVQYEKSINYLNKAIEKANDQNLNDLVFESKSSIAFYSHLLGKEKEAHDIADSLMKVAKTKDIDLLISRAHYLYYLLNNEDNNYKEALKHIKLSKPGPTVSEKAFRSINIGTAYFTVKQYDSALAYTQKGLKIAELNNIKQTQSNAHVQLKEIYLALKDYENAMKHTLKFEEISIKSGSFKSGMELVKINNEILEDKIKLQEQLTSERITNQRIVIWINVFALFILFSGILYIFNRLKFIRKQNVIIQQEKARAEQSEKHKEQFLANMSHEIRTPMHAISGMTNTLLRNRHYSNQSPYLEAMKTSSDNLLVLLNDILDLSKIDSGKLEIKQEIFNPIQVVKDIVQMLKYKAEEKELILKTNIEENFPEQIIGDAQRLTQILINLVGNAIKFTHSGNITIKLCQVDNAIQFEISDTGMGVEPDKINTIFKNFEQGERSRSQIYGGTGLGLSISKKLIELQNGKIWAESVVDKGSTFYFQLPMQTELSKKIINKNYQQTNLEHIKETIKDLNILIVDDDEFNIMVVKDDLNYYLKNVTLQVATNGQEAIDLFKQHSFDIILMDMHMPIMNGIDATEIIRELENNEKRIPILAMTANIIKSEIDKCLAAGMDDYIPKPYKPEDLIISIYNILNK
ncbi:tetratricopeptide repeat-containing hybrid sensor histidine kinase/response regulator [Formosa maritima]|uniref:histidine kinase n=1 Tax=Formosa maritima TaxID=2592046 RepID=A0A5D0G7Z7_9FLAO|nr:ATP-binding protein [Formosa maritima]TYA54770.1 response regulator [Formosa maritima]